MSYNNYFKLVENVLEKFPSDCRENYYENKKSVVIETKEKYLKSIYGDYDHEKNEITLYDESALPHEAFHMGFRDKDKVNKKIYEDKDIHYENGISYSFIQNSKKIICGKGLTEGFAECLSRKCGLLKGQDLYCYFTDLLISIYGEDIIYYVLKNDPVGFYSDCRFFDIFSYSNQLDYLKDFDDAIKIIANCKETFTNIFNSDDEKEKQKVTQNIYEIREGFKKSIIELFKLIIDEYINCSNPKIEKEQFIDKLLLFINTEEKNKYFIFDDSTVSLKKELKKIIKSFGRKNKKR